MQDDERVGALVAPPTEPVVLDAPGDPFTVRPHELITAVRDRLRSLGDDGPAVVHVTTAEGRLLGTVEAAAVRRVRA